MTRLVAFSMAAGIGSALALRFPVPLADPISCPGIFDFLAVIASRTWRDVPLGSMLAAGNSVVVFLALLLLARAVHKVTSVVGIAIAITLAAALSPLFAITLAPSAAAAFLAVVAAWGASPVFHTGAVALLALTAATVTPFTLPAVLLAGWLMRKRSLYAVLAVTIVLVSSLAVQAALPQGPSLSGASSFSACMLPGASLSSLIGAGRVMIAIVAANPLVAALAALGLISSRRLTRDVAMSLIALAAVSLWGTMIVPESTAAFELAVWLLAAVGLAEVWEVAPPLRAARYGGQARRGKVGAFALAAVLVVLQAVNANTRRKATSPADGHAQLTLAMVVTMVGSVPRGAAIVTEDASVDLLTRALPSRLRSADRFRFVPADPATIAEELRTSRVFVLPRSQRLLRDMAVELIDASSPGAAGLAEVRHVYACSAVLGSSPTPLPSIPGLQQFALVAGGEQSRDSVVIMLTAEVPLSVLPLAWPPDAMRGLHARTFDRTLARDERDFAEELRTYALLPWPGPATRYSTRIEAWRTPGAPLVLPFALGGSAGAGTARRLGSSPDQDLRLCPSFPYEVRPLARQP